MWLSVTEGFGMAALRGYVAIRKSGSNVFYDRFCYFTNDKGRLTLESGHSDSKTHSRKSGRSVRPRRSRAST